MQRVIFFAVVEFFMHALADLEMIIRRDGHVSAVEQRVQVGAEEQAVIGLCVPSMEYGRMWAASRTGRTPTREFFASDTPASQPSPLKDQNRAVMLRGGRTADAHRSGGGRWEKVVGGRMREKTRRRFLQIGYLRIEVIQKRHQEPSRRGLSAGGAREGCGAVAARKRSHPAGGRLAVGVDQAATKTLRK